MAIHQRILIARAATIGAGSENGTSASFISTGRSPWMFSQRMPKRTTNLRKARPVFISESQLEEAAEVP